MSRYVVKAAAVLVTVGLRDHLVEQGQFLPEDTPAETSERLLAKGMVEKVKAPVAETEKSVDKMTGPELKAYAAEKGIDLGGATKVNEVRAVIQAAEQAESDPGPDAPEGDTGDGSDE